MLKTHQGDIACCITQPDHAQVSGYLTAHWGNDRFARPGYYADSANAEELRAETVFGIAEHDNGWWEWEADPELSPTDGLPMGLTELLGNHQEGMDRWRRGVPRFRENHPYASLLISFHAYWLYAPRCGADSDPAFIHPLFGNGSPSPFTGEELEDARDFVSEVRQRQDELIARLRNNVNRAHWTDPKHLKPHARLIQLFDALSLSLCSALIPPRSGEAKGLGEDEFDMADVPRQSWDDRVTITVKPLRDRRIVCTPYPFDEDPLSVFVPARMVPVTTHRADSFPTWWHSQPIQQIGFHYCSEQHS